MLERLVAKKSGDSARLIWIPAFMAAAAYSNDTEAAEMTDVGAATSIKRRVDLLEAWLHRPLFFMVRPSDDISEGRILNQYGDDFVPVAWKIMQLIEEGGLEPDLGRTRVTPDARVTIDRVDLNTAVTREIGRLLVSCRASIEPGYKFHQKTSGKDIDMDALMAKLDD